MNNSNEFIKELKSRIPISDVVGKIVRLKKSGTSLMGLCPFHNERSPSFSVVESKKIYHCFGCQKNGDIISFVQETQAMSFVDAVRYLANEYGIQIPSDFSRGDPGKQSASDQNEVLYKLNHFVARYYHERLMSPEGVHARNYLADRGLTDETIQLFKIGFAPNEWGALVQFLNSKKAPIEKAEQLGLIKKRSDAAEGGAKSERTHYDLFRNRVIFPAMDLLGRVIAFGGRALNDEEKPKYLNSSESVIFKKSLGLFGIYHAQKDIRAEDICVVVEGFMDCIALHQAGFGYTVATLGTALTPDQVKLLKRFTKNIIVLFDGDAAGKAAQAKAMETFLNEDVVVRGITLPDEYDPDEFVKEKGREALEKLLKHAPYLLDQRISEIAEESGGHTESKVRALDQILPWIAKIPSETARFARIQNLSAMFSIGADALERRVQQLTPASSKRSAPLAPQYQQKQNSLVRGVNTLKSQESLDMNETKFLEMMVANPKLILGAEGIESAIGGIQSEMIQNLAKEILENIKNKAKLAPQIEFDAEILESVKSAEIKRILSKALVTSEQEKGKEIGSTERLEELNQEFKDLVSKLNRRAMEKRRDHLRSVILKADSSGNKEEVQNLVQEYNELIKKLM